MKRVLALVLSTLMVLSMVACGGSKDETKAADTTAAAAETTAAAAETTAAASDDKPYAGTTIHVLTANQTCLEQVVYPLLSEFTEKTGITVEWEILGNDDYASKASIELAAKSDSLDVIFLRPLTDLKQYLQNGWITDLSEVEDLSADAEYALDDFFAASLDSCSSDGVLYGIPIVAESQIMYYRKDLLEAKGIEVPKTLEELEAAADALTEINGGMYGFFMRGKSNALITQFSSILYSFGGRFNTATESLANSEAFAKATAWYGNMLKNYAPEGVANETWTEGAALFAQGKLAIFMDSDAIFGNITKDENLAITSDQIGFAPIPAGESGTPTPFYATIGAWSIPTFSKQKGAAMEFIKWASSKEMDLKMTVDVQNAGCRASTWENDEATGSFPEGMLDAMTYSRSVAIAGDRPTVINVGQARDILSVPIQAAILGQDYEALLESAHAEFQALIDEENAQ